jgi:hypothetical protein
VENYISTFPDIVYLPNITTCFFQPIAYTLGGYSTLDYSVAPSINPPHTIHLNFQCKKCKKRLDIAPPVKLCSSHIEQNKPEVLKMTRKSHDTLVRMVTEPVWMATIAFNKHTLRALESRGYITVQWAVNGSVRVTSTGERYVRENI